MTSLELTPLDCLTENVFVHPIVIAELKLRDVKREILLADLVEGSDHAAFQDRSKALNGLRMNRTDYVLTVGMVNRGVRVLFVEWPVADPLIGTKQTYLCGDGLAHKLGKSSCLDAGDDASDYISFAAHSADNRCLAGPNAASAPSAALVPMAIFGFAANKRLIDFDDTAKLVDVIDKRGTNALAHIPSCFVGAEAHVAHDLERAHPLLAGQH